MRQTPWGLSSSVALDRARPSHLPQEESSAVDFARFGDSSEVSLYCERNALAGSTRAARRAGQ
jgi:hypothetical protein